MPVDPSEHDRTDVYQDHAGEWRWRRIAGNNRIIADSGEGYDSERNAHRAAARVFAPPMVLPSKSATRWMFLRWVLAFLAGLLLGWLIWHGDNNKDISDNKPVPVTTVTTLKASPTTTAVTVVVGDAGDQTTTTAPTTATTSAPLPKTE